MNCPIGVNGSHFGWISNSDPDPLPIAHHWVSSMPVYTADRIVFIASVFNFVCQTNLPVAFCPATRLSLSHRSDRAFSSLRDHGMGEQNDDRLHRRQLHFPISITIWFFPLLHWVKSNLKHWDWLPRSAKI
jgi:hypothetical protein